VSFADKPTVFIMPAAPSMPVAIVEPVQCPYMRFRVSVGNRAQPISPVCQSAEIA
jgi:hypothetical protein